MHLRHSSGRISNSGLRSSFRGMTLLRSYILPRPGFRQPLRYGAFIVTCAARQQDTCSRDSPKAACVLPGGSLLVTVSYGPFCPSLRPGGCAVRAGTIFARRPTRRTGLYHQPGRGKASGDSAEQNDHNEAGWATRPAVGSLEFGHLPRNSLAEANPQGCQRVRWSFRAEGERPPEKRVG